MTSEEAAGGGGWALTALTSSMGPSYLTAPSPEARRLHPTRQGAGHRFLPAPVPAFGTNLVPAMKGRKFSACLFQSREDGDSQ